MGVVGKGEQDQGKWLVSGRIRRASYHISLRMTGCSALRQGSLWSGEVGFDLLGEPAGWEFSFDAGGEGGFFSCGGDGVEGEVAGFAVAAGLFVCYLFDV